MKSALGRCSGAAANAVAASCPGLGGAVAVKAKSCARHVQHDAEHNLRALCCLAGLLQVFGFKIHPSAYNRDASSSRQTRRPAIRRISQSQSQQQQSGNGGSEDSKQQQQQELEQPVAQQQQQQQQASGGTLGSGAGGSQAQPEQA